MIGRIKDALVINRGIIIDQHGRIIAESLINYDNDELFDKEVVPAYDSAVLSKEFIPLPDNKGPYVILKQTWDANYGHWLIEVIASGCRRCPTVRFERTLLCRVGQRVASYAKSIQRFVGDDGNIAGQRLVSARSSLPD